MTCRIRYKACCITSAALVVAVEANLLVVLANDPQRPTLGDFCTVAAAVVNHLIDWYGCFCRRAGKAKDETVADANMTPAVTVRERRRPRAHADKNDGIPRRVMKTEQAT